MSRRSRRGFALRVRAIEPRPDILLCFVTSATGAIGVEVGRRLGIPAVVWIRGEADYRHLDLPGRRDSVPQIWARAAAVLVQSATIKADFLDELQRASPSTLPIVQAKLAVVENGLDLPQLCPYRPDGPVVSAGRLVPEKGMNTVIDACARLSRPLVIAGDGPELPALQAQAAALGADVLFTGLLDRADMDDLYRQASVIVLASHSEGTPNVVLEAMAHGRPVVATSVGGVTDLIEDGVNGLLISVGDGDALVSALTRLAADPEMGSRLGSAARVSVERFEWPQVLPKLEAVLQRCR
jgi:glycosyltransferase involved in cell wall biosynthesis